MIRFTIAVSNELNAWLEEQARLHKRSKSAEVFAILEEVAKKDIPPHRVAGSIFECYDYHHYFPSDRPQTGDKCNCGEITW